METDARGQLGGVETTDAVRKRLADESGAYKCTSCGKSNAEIIKESEARCAEQGGDSATDTVEIPSELKMGYRDELEAKKATTAEGQVPSTASTANAGYDDAEAAELAEGFVQTASQTAPNPVAAGAIAERAPAQGLPRPTPAGVSGGRPRN